jgi:uncharacterized membrane protein
VLMALDHTRDYFGDFAVPATDLARASGPLFLTRWVTHFCAPAFIMLAGIAAFFAGSRGKSPAELSRFLLARGLWLVLLELTVVRLGWYFDLSYVGTELQVIWAIGWSMVALAALVRLPTWAVAAIAVATIGLHNLFDGVRADTLGAARPLWIVLHEQGVVARPGGSRVVFVVYPLIPWIGLMAAGYSLGPWMTALPPAQRRRRLVALGAAMIVAFLALRLGAFYGDPHPWQPQSTVLRSVLALLNCTKYPPSLLYLLMTVGPTLVLLGVLDGAAVARPARWLVVFGRVPLFYYVLHLYLIHGLAVLARRGAVVPYGASGMQAGSYGLPGVYLAWITVVLAMYLPCRWFAGVKERRRDWWLSYL